MILVWQAILLGVVQGVTEVWPISSSAHLTLIPPLLGWESALLNSLAFDVALHAGTLIAACVYFREDLWDMTRCWWSPKDSASERENKRLGVILVVATLPAVLAGLFLEDAAATYFRAPQRVAMALILGGILMGVVDRWRSRKVDLSQTRRRDALWVGLAQALSIMPGVSRSGITLTALRFLELKRPDAARLTFLMSIPLTAGAVVWESRHFFEGFHPGEGLAVFVGMVAAGLAGYISLRFFMGFLRKKSLWGFALYRVVFGGVVLMMVYFRG